MRSGQQPDPADARQSGPDHHQPRAAARRRLRRRRARKPAPLGAGGAGPEQLRAAIRQCRARRRRNFLENLFGNNSNPSAPGADLGPQSGTYRTVCVRTCDGAYFPVSFATVPARFPDDERSCKALCPAAEATLFAYRNPGEDINQAVSISGQPYSALPNAFKFRTEFNPSCGCKAVGQTWSDALKTIDDKAAAEQQGDIIVTEESAKKMARPKPAPASAKKGAAPAATTATAPAAPAAEPPAALQPMQPARPRTSRSVRSARPLSRPIHRRVDLLLVARLARRSRISRIGRRFAPTRFAPSGLQELNPYPSNASADPRAARDTRASSGAGSDLPVSRNLLVMG